MLTNTYLPHVGGVARSVAAFTAEYRRQGHRVLVVAPEFEKQPPNEEDVVRIPAIQHFNGSDFSAVLPVSGLLNTELDNFKPDIVHSHHPYLLGMTAMRIARFRQLPLVFTHHTLYEQYTHYVPVDSPAFRRFVIELATRYANLSDQVFAPSESIAKLLHERGTTAPVTVIPTGIKLSDFSNADGGRVRARLGIPDNAFVVGHLGRLAPEKNLEFLATAIARFLKNNAGAHFILAGEGPSAGPVREILSREGVLGQLHDIGIVKHPELADTYAAMNVFAFASTSETQGMVLTEAMAAGVPVVGIDATGVREVIRDEYNGRLLQESTVDDFVAALQWVSASDSKTREALHTAALATAEKFSMERTAGSALACYEKLIAQGAAARAEEYGSWESTMNLVKTEWDIIQGLAAATGAAIRGNDQSGSMPL
ncbi:glycosyltransferase [Kineobactrum sediminis]|nr:glycosyltransferase [Kineobactrum sediminis]